MIEGWALMLIRSICQIVHALGAQKVSHCPPHSHQCCDCCAAEAASLVTTTAIVPECTSNI